jgi:ATP-dependent Clp protease ATP-binding subunit ClpC
MSVDLQKVRDSVEFIVGRGDFRSDNRGLTPRAKKVIELSVDEARRLQHQYVGTEHLLLGVLSVPDSHAAGLLERVGVSVGAVRAALEPRFGDQDTA